MKAKFDGYNWVACLEKGEKLMEGLLKIAEKQQTKTAWIFGIGAAAWVEYGYYDLAKKDYVWTKTKKNVEILSLQGNLTAAEDHPHLHLHGTFSDETGQVFGGHVKDLEVSVTCEFFIHDWFGSEPIGRSLDDETGLRSLDL